MTLSRVMLEAVPSLTISAPACLSRSLSLSLSPFLPLALISALGQARPSALFRGAPDCLSLFLSLSLALARSLALSRSLSQTPSLFPPLSLSGSLRLPLARSLSLISVLRRARPRVLSRGGPDCLSRVSRGGPISRHPRSGHPTLNPCKPDSLPLSLLQARMSVSPTSLQSLWNQVPCTLNPKH